MLASGSDTPASAKVEIAKKVTVDGTALPAFSSVTNDPGIGETAPGLSGQTFNGKAVSVTDDGKAHVLVFVAHWCPHCQTEIPRIVELEKSGGTKGVAVTAVSTGTDKNAPNFPPSAWLKDEGWPYPVLVDTASSTAGRAYGLTAYPYLVFVDANGKVAARVTGEIEPTALAKMFSALAAGDKVPIPGSGASSQG